MPSIPAKERPTASTSRVDRRRFIGGALALGATQFVPALALAQPRLSGNPFTLGVASGYPLSTNVVLWTRLAPTPLIAGGGMPREVVPVEWEVATDEGMSSSSLERVRKHGVPEAVTLDEYRHRYALYKTDPDLQAAHAAYPWIVTWDDHEVANDYADDRSEQLHPREWFLHRRAAGYQAFYEHLPLRRQMVPLGPHARIYHRVAFGELVQFHLLDDRQYRSHQPCVEPGRGGGPIVENCGDRLDARLTLLGDTQERWLQAGLDCSRAGWNVIGQQTLMAQLDRKPGPGQQFRTDGWDGYPMARRRLLECLGQRKPANPVVIGGDVHSFWVTDLKPDFDDPRSPVVGTEFVATSITSPVGRTLASPETLLPDNPHVRFANGARRGYTRVEVTPDRLRADLRAMRTVTQPQSEADTLASFVVENGRPGAVRA